jgi:putative transposase
LGGRRGRLISSETRQAVITLISEARLAGARKHKACDMLGLSVRTLERWEKTHGVHDRRKMVKRNPANKLTKEQRDMVVSTVNNPIYRDLPPCKIVPLLADKGCYIASESTFYRVLRAENQLTHRQTSRPAKNHRPEPYSATGPNQVWSWDISYLPSQVAGLYFYLYMIIDIYSRKIVGFSVHDQELSKHGAALITQAYLDEGVLPKQLVLHSDNGGPMKGATMLVTLEKLGVVPSFSRPSVSDDNPYSEALFRTVKYHPTFPMLDKFATILDARKWSENFVRWYNNDHLHSTLKFVTPNHRHTGIDKAILANRHQVYQKAKTINPERWTGQTRNWSLPDTVTLNPNRKNKQNDPAASNDAELTPALEFNK